MKGFFALFFLSVLLLAAVNSDPQPRSERRVLSVADVERLIRALSPFKGQKVSLAHIGADGEAAQLADQLDAIMHGAGWVQPGPVQPGPVQSGPVDSRGVAPRGNYSWIDLTVPERTRASDALWNGLLAAGLDVTAHLDPAEVPHGAISIFVSARP